MQPSSSIVRILCFCLLDTLIDPTGPCSQWEAVVVVNRVNLLHGPAVLDILTGTMCIRQEWTAKDGAAAQQLVQQLQEVAQQQGHPLAHTDTVGTMVIAELTTTPKGERLLGPTAAARTTLLLLAAAAAAAAKSATLMSRNMS
jgi:hypothetical protein